jgi:hypothetical protein
MICQTNVYIYALINQLIRITNNKCLILHHESYMKLLLNSSYSHAQ